MSDFGILRKGLWISCQTVIETTANTDHEIRFGHGNVGRKGSVHPTHSKEERMVCRNRSLT